MLIDLLVLVCFGVLKDFFDFVDFKGFLIWIALLVLVGLVGFVGFTDFVDFMCSCDFDRCARFCGCVGFDGFH